MPIRPPGALVDLLGTVARSSGATPAQIGPGVAAGAEPWIVPIPATRWLPRPEGSLAAEATVATDSFLLIGMAISKAGIQGARCPGHLECQVEK